MPDTKVVDDPEAYKLSKVEAAIAPAKVGTPSSISTEPFPSRSAKKNKSFESERALTVTLPAEGFAYSDPSFVKDLSEALLLSADCKRLADIGPVQSVELSMAHIYQVSRCKICSLIFVLSVKLISFLLCRD